MGFTVRHLAELVQGEVCGDDQRVITAARPLGAAGPGEITFLEHERNAKKLKGCQASAVVVPEKLATNGLTIIRVAHPMTSFVTIARLFQDEVEAPVHGIDSRADVHPTAQIGAEASIHAFASIGAKTVLGARCRVHAGARIGANCRLGDDVTIHPNVVLYDRTVLGHRVIVHANAVLGADGFGYRLIDGIQVKVHQLGWVEIGADVEIGAGTAIDRGTFEATVIGEGTKIDNLVQVGHNCQIGRHNLLVSHVAIAGSCRTGDYVVIAGQAGLADRVVLSDGVVVGAQSGVWRDVQAGERVLGSPAFGERAQKRSILCLEKLPEVCRDVRKIKQHLGLVENGQSAPDSG